MQPDGEVNLWLSEGQSAYEVEILEQDFELKAWLKEIRLNSESLDQFDPLIKEMEFSFETFREDLSKTMHLSPMSTTKGFFSPNGTLVAELEIWSDSLKEEYIAHPFSIGQRWWICLETLLEYLKHKNRDLIIEIQIEHKSKSDSHREQRDDFEESTICLLRRDGTLETLDNHRDIRQTDCERTRPGG